MDRKRMTYEKAVSILRGSGIRVDEKNRTQTWAYGRIYTEKQAMAGTFLDKYNIESNGEFKTVWLTVEQVNENKRKLETLKGN